MVRLGWKLMERHHIHETYAAQVALAKQVSASQFLTGDKRLHEIALKEGLNSAYLG